MGVLMAFDQVSLFLFPPRWMQHSVAHESLKHYSGEPVRIVSAVRGEQCNARPVKFDELCRWFEAKQFEVVNRSIEHGYFCSAPIESGFGRRPEIVVSSGTVNGEVTSLYCRFQLNRESPFRLERWEAFMHDFCGEFNLRISVSDTESVGPGEFVSVVRRSDNWRCFADQLGWSAAEE